MDEEQSELLKNVIYSDNLNVIDHAVRNHRRFVHYTSVEAALSIIENREVWLRNSLAMNDYSEIAYGEQLFRGVFYGESDVSHLSRKVLNQINDGLHERLSQAFEEGAVMRRHYTYLMSVSEHGPYQLEPGMLADQGEERYGRLSMWRAYGGGIAFVFNSQPLLSPSEALKAYTSPVRYVEQHEFNHLVSCLLFRASDNIDALKGLPEGLFEYNLKNFIELTALSLKHPGFSEEREWRITYSAKPAEEHDDDVEFNESSRVKRDFRTINGIPQRIYKIPFQNYPDDGFLGAEIDEILDRVIIGPSQYPALVADAIFMALKRAGVRDAEKRIVVSNIPIRT